MLSGRLPKALQARIGVRQPTVFFGQPGRLGRGRCQPRAKRWMQLCLGPVWQTEQKLSEN